MKASAPNDVPPPAPKTSPRPKPTSAARIEGSWPAGTGIQPYPPVTSSRLGSGPPTRCATEWAWSFVGAFALFLAAWVIANSVFSLFGSGGKHGFDPYPYILLNLFLSMLAAIQGAILLIAVKRSDQIASQLAEHDYQTDSRAFESIQALHQRLAELAESNRDLLERNSQILQHLAVVGPPDIGPTPSTETA